MSTFDTANDWFKSNAVSYASTGSEKSQADINKQLAAIAEEERKRLQKEKQDYIDMFEPEDKEFDYKVYEGISDDEMKKIAEGEYNDYYNDSNSSIDYEYDGEIKEADANISEAKDSAKEDSGIVTEDLDDDIKEFRDSAYVKGILDSTIVGSKNTELDEIADDEIIKIIEAMENDVNIANESKLDAKYDMDSSKKDLLTDYGNKVDKHIKTQTSDQNKEKDKIDDLNNATKKEEEAFGKFKQDIVTAKSKEYDDEFAALQKHEARYGYSGTRAAHYEKRVQAANSYYRQYPVDQAMDMIRANPELSELLGHEYNKFVQGYRNA